MTRSRRSEIEPAGIAPRAASSSARTLFPASGSRKFAVPTATAVAPAAKKSSADKLLTLDPEDFKRVMAGEEPSIAVP